MPGKITLLEQVEDLITTVRQMRDYTPSSAEALQEDLRYILVLLALIKVNLS